MDTRERNANGTFKPGGKLPENARRARGVSNKITADIKAGAIAGFARHGSNGRGEGGFSGFCYYLAKKHPKAAVRIIEKLLPLQVNATGMSGPTIKTINVVSIDSGDFLSQEDMNRLQNQNSQTIDHAPQLIEHHAPPPPIEETSSPSEEAVIDDLKNQINELAQKLGVPIVV